MSIKQLIKSQVNTIIIKDDTVAIKVIDLNRPNKDILIQFLYS